MVSIVNAHLVHCNDDFNGIKKKYYKKYKYIYNGIAIHIHLFGDNT